MASADAHLTSGDSSPDSIPKNDREQSIGSEEPLADSSSSPENTPLPPAAATMKADSANARYNGKSNGSTKGTSSKGYWISKQKLIGGIFFILAFVVLVALIVGLSVQKNDCNNLDVLSAKALTESEDLEQIYEQDIRLPEEIVPLHYTVELAPKLDPEFIFTGSVNITVKVAQQTDKIILHSKGLTINKEKDVAFQAENPSKPSPSISSVVFDEKKDFIIIYLSDSLIKDEEYNVFIRFKGELTDRLNGLYRSSYKKADGTKTWLMASQMQPTDARRAFPCFDEPALKATFQINFIRPSHLKSISNMDIVRTEIIDNGLLIDVYNTSVPMSTYLLAFVLSDFDYRETISEGGTKIRIWARPDAMEDAEYALSITGRMLTYFEKYFKIDFPLNKLDQVAVPDFQAGAMEN